MALALVTAGIAPVAAHGDGLPVPVDDAGPTGVTSTDGSSRYVTVPAQGGTVVERIERRGGRISAYAFLHGRFTIPVVALDGTPGGISSNGRTLILIRPRAGFPRARTTLAVLDARPLRTPSIVTLRGDFSFDALSPDGRTAYLVQYTSRRDPTHYLVRALDPTTGRLLPQPIVDPNERADEMRGFPLTRATSADGRWHYTLYNGNEGHPFIHALDTQGRRARCIDLPAYPPSANLYAFRLSVGPGGGRLTVSDRKRPVALIDTKTFRVSTPTRHSAQRPDAGETGTGWTAAAIGAAALLLSGTLALLKRRRQRLPTYR